MTPFARKASPLGDAPGYGNRQDPGFRAADTDPSLRRLAAAMLERGGVGGRTPVAYTAVTAAVPSAGGKSCQSPEIANDSPCELSR